MNFNKLNIIINLIFENFSFYEGLSNTKKKALERTLNEAVKEAIDDDTFRKVQRLSYGQHGPDEVCKLNIILSNRMGRL